jgi:hypothetical protein
VKIGFIFLLKVEKRRKLRKLCFSRKRPLPKDVLRKLPSLKCRRAFFFFFHEFFKKSEILRFRCQVPGIQLDGGRAYRKGRRSGGGGGLFGWLVCVGCCPTNAGAACQRVIRLFAVTQPPPLFGILDQGAVGRGICCLIM